MMPGLAVWLSQCCPCLAVVLPLLALAGLGQHISFVHSVSFSFFYHDIPFFHLYLSLCCHLCSVGHSGTLFLI
jgi:hypothetical protein